MGATFSRPALRARKLIREVRIFCDDDVIPARYNICCLRITSLTVSLSQVAKLAIWTHLLRWTLLGHLWSIILKPSPLLTIHPDSILLVGVVSVLEDQVVETARFVLLLSQF